MTPHPRIRKSIKLGGLTIGAALLVVWIVSGWVYASCTFPGGNTISIGSGCAWSIGGFRSWSGPLPSGWAWGTQNFRIYPIGNYEGSPTFRYIGLPLWLPGLAAGLFGAAAWHLDAKANRRARMHLCRNCRYDRTGLAAGAVCPECGTPGAAV